MATAKAINPVEKTVTQMDAAYDAAFESDTKAAVPYPGETLQGFAVLLFVFSYFSLAVIATIMVNAVTLNPAAAIGTFAAFVVVGFIMLGLFRQFG
jgi:positive regulator of sigma E activity